MSQAGNRLDRRAVVGGALATCAGFAAWPARSQDGGRAAQQAASIPIEVNARPIAHFERGRPEGNRLGELRFLGGLVLTSSSPRFGGWSGLEMAPDGKNLLAVSDAGQWLSAEVDYRAGQPAGIAHARVGALVDERGQPLAGKRAHDAEALALLDGTLARGTVLIGFERQHRIVKYELRDGAIRAPIGALAMPADAGRLYENQGIEALAVLKGGRLKGAVVGFAERLTRGSGYHTGWIWAKGGTGEPQRFQLRDVGQFNITDAAGLPNGDLLVLERRFRWSEGIFMRLRRILAREIAPGARMAGRVLLEADGRYEIDNMEGLAVHRDARGEIVVSMISDDNFNGLLQRTVLLQFVLGDTRV
jgi:hypothetical protein